MPDLLTNLAVRGYHKLMVVTPHPDDEIFALGGTCAVASCAGWHIVILAVTDGEASHSGSLLTTPVAMATRRNKEVESAYAALGFKPRRNRLGLPDGAVTEAALKAALAGRLEPDSVVFAPLSDDGHPDHDACGAVAKLLASQHDLPFFAYPVWAHHRPPPSAVRGVEWCTLLPPEILEAKIAAMECFQSQLIAIGPLPEDGPVLHEGFREPFSRPFEVAYS